MLIQCWCIVIIGDSFDDFDNFDVANKQKSNNIRVILIKSSQLDEEVLDTITKTVMSSNCWGRYELRREFIIKKNNENEKILRKPRSIQLTVKVITSFVYMHRVNVRRTFPRKLAWTTENPIERCTCKTRNILCTSPIGWLALALWCLPLSI